MNNNWIPPDPNATALIRASDIPTVNLEEYDRNREKLNAALNHVILLHNRNEAGVRKFAITELQKKVEEGRRAEAMLNGWLDPRAFHEDVATSGGNASSQTFVPGLPEGIQLPTQPIRGAQGNLYNGGQTFSNTGQGTVPVSVQPTASSSQTPHYERNPLNDTQRMGNQQAFGFVNTHPRTTQSFPNNVPQQSWNSSNSYVPRPQPGPANYHAPATTVLSSGQPSSAYHSRPGQSTSQTVPLTREPQYFAAQHSSGITQPTTNGFSAPNPSLSSSSLAGALGPSSSRDTGNVVQASTHKSVPQVVGGSRQHHTTNASHSHPVASGSNTSSIQPKAVFETGTPPVAGSPLGSNAQTQGTSTQSVFPPSSFSLIPTMTPITPTTYEHKQIKIPDSGSQNSSSIRLVSHTQGTNKMEFQPAASSSQASSNINVAQTTQNPSLPQKLAGANYRQKAVHGKPETTLLDKQCHSVASAPPPPEAANSNFTATPKGPSQQPARQDFTRHPSYQTSQNNISQPTTATAGPSKPTMLTYENFYTGQTSTHPLSTGVPNPTNLPTQTSGLQQQNVMPTPWVYVPYGYPIGVTAPSRTSISQPLNQTGFVPYPGSGGRTYSPPQSFSTSSSVDPHTPIRANPVSQPLTPASANKSSLAKDILRALGPPSAKRKMSAEPLDEPSSKKQAVGNGILEQLENVTASGLVPPIQPQSVQEAYIEEIPRTPSPHPKSPVASSQPNLPLLDEMTLPLITKLAPNMLPEEEDEEEEEEDVAEKSVQDISQLASALAENIEHAEKPSLSTTEDAILGIDGNYHQNNMPISQAHAEPLFLPSPRTSPQLHAVASPSADSVKPINIGPRRKYEVFVLIPPAPDWVKKAKAVQERPSRPDPSEEKNPEVDLVPHEEINNDAEVAKIQKAAKAVKELSLSCLRRKPCLWKDCGQILNSSKTCITHLQEHVAGERRQDNEMSWISYPCNYDQCVRRFKDPDVLKTHLERHELRTLSCPYEGCEHVLHDTRELAYHGTLGHPSGKLRSTYTPKKPSTITKVPVMPAEMPAYMAISTPVAAERMSKDRHARLGPWVLRNIFGPVNLDVPKHNARYPLRNSRRIGEKEARIEAKSHAGPPDEYDFLGSYATYPNACSDLENAYVSDKVDAGLVLWPGKSITRKDTSPIRRVDTGAGTKQQPETTAHSAGERPEATSNDATVGASLLEIPDGLESRGVGSDEEKAVEDLV